MRGTAVYKQTFNAMLDALGEPRASNCLMNESALAKRFDVSRTTVRKAIAEISERGLIRRVDGHWVVATPPHRSDYFSISETVPTSVRVEKKFMYWMLRGDSGPGDVVNGLELARQFGVSAGAIREYLNRFARFGLIERRPNSSWIFRGFTREFALEIFEVREMFEIRSAMGFATLLQNSPAWGRLRALEAEHRTLLRGIDSDYHDFSDLDERLHRLINDTSQNRFIVDFYGVISMIFHYHYQWNKRDERERNQAAIYEHLDYIEALLSRDPRRIELSCISHLNSARKTLLASIGAPDGGRR
ncbi:MAG: GntR family transcriptional regulator [Bradyrhizobium sp.]|nr:MAG: GntR family transcriptional regulator [Bradyrhizobium sp.]